MNTLEMTKEYVVNYINENNLTVELLDNTEPAMEGLYRFTGPAGHHTFEMRMCEDAAKYASVMTCRLTKEHNVDFGSAERLATAYVSTFKVMQDDAGRQPTKEEYEAILEACTNHLMKEEESHEVPEAEQQALIDASSISNIGQGMKEGLA